jgi:hypothetical protein
MRRGISREKVPEKGREKGPTKITSTARCLLSKVTLLSAVTSSSFSPLRLSLLRPLLASLDRGLTLIGKKNHSSNEMEKSCYASIQVDAYGAVRKRGTLDETRCSADESGRD